MRSNRRQWFAILVAVCSAGCASPIPKFRYQKSEFPKNAFVGVPDARRFERIGSVRARADFLSMDPENPNANSQILCRNYYNRAVNDLVKFAREKKADAVIEVKSVVFMMDGKTELHDSPECADDGAEGQALVQGVAVKWILTPEEEAAKAAAANSKRQ